MAKQGSSSVCNEECPSPRYTVSNSLGIVHEAEEPGRASEMILT